MAKVTLNSIAKEEVALWIKILKLSNGRSIVQSPYHVLLQTDASKKGLVHCAKG